MEDFDLEQCPGWNPRRKLIQLPPIVTQTALHYIARSTVFPGIEKFKPQIDMILELLPYKRYVDKKTKQKKDVIVCYYGEDRANQIFNKLVQALSQCGEAESYLRGLYEGTIKRSNVDDKRYVLWRKSTIGLFLLQPEISMMKKLLIENTTLEETHPQSHHYQNATLALIQLQYNIEQEKKKQQEENAKTQDSEGTPITNKYIDDRYE